MVTWITSKGNKVTVEAVIVNELDGNGNEIANTEHVKVVAKVDGKAECVTCLSAPSAAAKSVGVVAMIGRVGLVAANHAAVIDEIATANSDTRVMRRAAAVASSIADHAKYSINYRKIAKS